MRINAVFEGGGVKAIGLVGAVKSAEEHGIEFKRLAGTSSGAVVSALLVAGYTADELKEIIEENPFASFLDEGSLGWGRSLARLFIKKGLHSGKPLQDWIERHLRKKGIETFSDLESGQLHVVASDITNGRMLVLPEDIRLYGGDPDQLKVSAAVRMSASLPYFFEPVILKPRGKAASYIVDGGLLSNFPLWLFDRDYSSNESLVPAIGFYLVGKQNLEPNRIYGPLTMFKALFSTMMEAHDERYIEKHARFRTVKVPTLGIKTTQFDISPEESKMLYEAGLAAGRAFFNQWSMTTYFSAFHKEVAPKFRTFKR